MGDAIGSKNTCKTFSTEFFDWRIQSKNSTFSTGSASRNSQSNKVESKKPFFDCVRKPDLGFSRKRPFSTDKSDCIRNGLESEELTAKTDDCSILHTKQPGLLALMRTILLSSSNANNCKTRAQLALPRAACSHHGENDALIRCFVAA